MKFEKTALYINLVLFIAAAALGTMAGGMVGLGLAAIIVALLNIPLAIIFHIAGRHPSAQTAWIFLAIWGLVGFSVCSSVAFNLH